LESVWALSEGYFTSPAGDQWPDKAVEINNTYSEAMNVLTKSWLDYLIADKHYLDKAEVVKSKEGKTQLKIADHYFNMLVLPPLFILSQSTSKKIVEFAEAGGWVVVLGDLPNGSSEVGLNDQTIKGEMVKLNKLPTVIDLSNEPDKMKILPKRIKEVLEPQIEMVSGDLPLLISHRKVDNKDFYWLANNSGIEETVTLSLRDGKGAAEIWDCETGEMKKVEYKRLSNRNNIDLEFNGFEGFWLVFDPSKTPNIIERKQSPEMVEIDLTEPWKIRYPETNTINVTSARSFIVSDTITHNEFLNSDYDNPDWNYINIVGNIRLEGSWKATMFYNPDPDSKRYYRYKFVLADDPEGAIVNINGDNGVKFWVNGNAIKPGRNAEGWFAFDTHDIKSLLKKGENVIAVEELNHLGYGWMVFQGLVHLNNGEEIEVFSNSDWKESSILSPNWQNIKFDDSSWGTPLLASETLAKSEFLRMRRPNKIIFSKSTVWWRFDVVPNAEYLLLPGLSKEAKTWVDGKSTSITDEKIILHQNAKVVIVKNGEDANGLTKQAKFYCDGWSKTNLISWLDMGLRRFTGFIDYETTFDLPSDKSNVVIDLGKVRYMAEVWLNGKKIGERLWSPYVFKAESSKVGENKIRVRVGNLMVNEMGGKDDLNELRTWGWQTPPDSSFEAGLFGPVKIKITKGIE